MKVVFRTQCQDLWGEWDPAFLWEVARRASLICVRIAGLVVRDRAAGPYTSDEPLTLAWEQAIKHMLFDWRGKRQHGIAFVIIQANHYPRSDRPLERGTAIPRGREVFERWTLTLPLAERLGLLLWILHGETQRPILLHVEDFSARWALESGFRPDLWLMDNPFVGYGEAWDLWRESLSRPGALRNSKMMRMREWSGWRMHIRREELLARHLPLTGTHGQWPRRASLGPFVPVTTIIESVTGWTSTERCSPRHS